MFRLTFVVSIFFLLAVSSSYADHITDQGHHHHEFTHTHDGYESHTHAQGFFHTHGDEAKQDDPRRGIPHYNHHGWSFSHAGVVQGVSRGDSAPDPQTETQPGTSPQVARPPIEIQRSVVDKSGTNQPEVAQPAVTNQPEAAQPAVTSPVIAQPVISTAPDSEPAPQESRPPNRNAVVAPVTKIEPKLLVTEYMIRDYSRSGGAGLPQWIEIYNWNAEAMELKGYQFTYAWRNTANSPYRYKTETIDSFVIPAREAKIIVNKEIEARWNTIGGLSAEDIWVIPSEENWVSLKDGWHLADPSGKAIYRIGGAFEEKHANAEWDDSIPWRVNVRLPPHTSEGFRTSYQAFPSELLDEDHFYGNIEDSSAVAVVVNPKTTYELVGKSSPGFFKLVEIARAAPSLLRPKKVIIWGNLKRAK